jgi:peroxiredoxin
MRNLIIFWFLSLSTTCKSQKFVMKDYSDSMHSVYKSHIGKSFPDFKARDINGKYFSDSLLRGKITLINLWFEGCRPCIAEFKRLNEIFANFQNNKLFNFITFTFDDYSKINESITKYSLKFPVIHISEIECHRLNFGAGFPTNIIVDKDGKVAFYNAGGPLYAADASKEIDSTILPELSKLINRN